MAGFRRMPVLLGKVISLSFVSLMSESPWNPTLHCLASPVLKATQIPLANGRGTAFGLNPAPSLLFVPSLEFMSPQRRNPPEMSVIPILLKSVPQFGVGMLFAAIFAAATHQMYKDLERKNTLLVEIVREQTRAAQDVASALQTLTQLISK